MRRPDQYQLHSAARSESYPRARWTGASDPPSIEPRLAWRARFEALVQPIILFWHQDNLLLDEGIHAPRILLNICAGKIFPRRIKAGDIAAIAGQLTRYTGNDTRS